MYRRKLTLSALSLFLLALLAACTPVSSAEEVVSRMEQARQSESHIHHVQEMTFEAEGEVTSTVMETWRDGPARARLDQRTPQGELTGVTLIDGAQMLTYDARANTVTEMTLPDLEHAADVSLANDGMIAMVQSTLEQVDFTIIGVEEVAGRQAVHLRGEPKAEAQAASNAGIAFPGVDTYDLWIDTQTYVTLATDVSGEHFSMRQRTTFIDFDPDLSDEIFAFTPPADAERIELDGFVASDLSLDAMREAVDFVLLTPAFVPDGFASEQMSVVEQSAIQLFSNGEQIFSLVQTPSDRAINVIANEDSARAITLRGQEAIVQQNLSGLGNDVQLSWQENGIQIILGGTVDEATLVQIAEELE